MWIHENLKSKFQILFQIKLLRGSDQDLNLGPTNYELETLQLVPSEANLEV